MEIYPKIKFEHFPAGEVVFNHGDYGDKFYIIMKGEVGVIIPKKVSNQANNMNDTQSSIGWGILSLNKTP